MEKNPLVKIIKKHIIQYVFVAVFLIGLAAGAGSEKTNEFLIKRLLREVKCLSQQKIKRQQLPKQLKLNLKKSKIKLQNNFSNYLL